VDKREPDKKQQAPRVLGHGRGGGGTWRRKRHDVAQSEQMGTGQPRPPGNNLDRRLAAALKELTTTERPSTSLKTGGEGTVKKERYEDRSVAIGERSTKTSNGGVRDVDKHGLGKAPTPGRTERKGPCNSVIGIVKKTKP